jgi:hypothetical protein
MQRASITSRLDRLESEIDVAPEPVLIFLRRINGVTTNSKTSEEFPTEEEARAAAGNPEFCVVMCEVDGRRKPKENEHAAD